MVTLFRSSIWNSPKILTLCTFHRSSHFYVVFIEYSFEVRVEVDLKQVYKSLNKLLTGYKDEKRGPTVVVIQSAFDFQTLQAGIPSFADFPMIPIHISDSETLYNVLDWQRVGAKTMLNHFFKYNSYLQVLLPQEFALCVFHCDFLIFFRQ